MILNSFAGDFLYTSANQTALNKTVNYTYSGLIETRTTVTDQQETVTLVYDAKGNLLSQADSKGTITYTYDAAGNRIKEEWESSQNSGTVDYTYDEWGNPLTAYRCDKDESYVSSETAAWELRYYPDGVPNTVRYAINEADDITW